MTGYFRTAPHNRKIGDLNFASHHRMAQEEVEWEAAPSFVSFLLCCLDASPAASSGLAFYCAVEVFFFISLAPICSVTSIDTKVGQGLRRDDPELDHLHS